MLGKWFLVEVLKDDYGFKKGEQIYVLKETDTKYKVFDGRNVEYNQAICLNLEEMKDKFKTIRNSNNKIQYVNNKKQNELDGLARALSRSLD